MHDLKASHAKMERLRWLHNCRESAYRQQTGTLSPYLQHLIIFYAIGAVMKRANYIKLAIIAIAILTFGDTNAEEENINKVQIYLQDYEQDQYDIYRSAFQKMDTILVNFDFTFARSIDYDIAPSHEHANPGIYVLTPLKWIQFSEHFKQQLIPLGIVLRSENDDPYYSCLIVASKSSAIESIFAEDIEKIYLVNKKSTSGYLFPLNLLWQSQLIKAPTLAAAQKNFEVDIAGSHNAVREKVTYDRNSIGATWRVYPNDGLNVILRYGLIPDDIIAISKNLEGYDDDLINAFNDSTVTKILSQSPLNVVGMQKHTLEHKGAFSTLQAMVDMQSKMNKDYFGVFGCHYLLIGL